MSEDTNFEALSPELASDERALIVDVEGFEGPLDLLLMLARQQKVDLSKISILALADQYLAFIEEARKIRLELAAGCDVVLHCNGTLDEMRAVAGVVPPLSGNAARRADAALSSRREPEPFDIAAAREEFAAMSVSA